MELKIEEEKDKLVSLIKQEQDLNNMIINELLQENSIDLIYLNSQLAAEKARSAYFCNVMFLKKNNEELDIESVKMRLSTGSTEDQISPFSDSLNMRDRLNHSSSSTRYSERFSLSISQGQIEAQTKLKRCERKIEMLNEQLEEMYFQLNTEQKRNEDLKEIIFRLEEKMKAKDSMFSAMKTELKSREEELEESEKSRTEHEEMIKKKTNEEIEKIRLVLNSEKEKCKNLEENSESQKKELEDDLKEKNLLIKELRNENKQLIKNSTKMKEEVERLKEKNTKAKNKMMRQFETEKKDLELENKRKIDELKMNLKLYEKMQENNSCSEYSDNELFELEDSDRPVESEPSQATFEFMNSTAIKVFDIDHIPEESLSGRSHLQTATSNCQTECELIDIEEYNRLSSTITLLENQLENNLKSFKSLEEKLRLFLYYLNNIFVYADLPELGSYSVEDLQSFLGRNDKKIKEILQRFNERGKITAKDTQNKTSDELGKKEKIVLFRRKCNPIVSSLFRNL